MEPEPYISRGAAAFSRVGFIIAYGNQVEILLVGEQGDGITVALRVCGYFHACNCTTTVACGRVRFRNAAVYVQYLLQAEILRRDDCFGVAPVVP